MLSLLLFYFLFIAGLLLLFLRASTTPGNASGAMAADDDVLPPPEGQLAATTRPAWMTFLAVSGGMLLGMVYSQGTVRLSVPTAGHIPSWIPSDSTAGFVVLVAFLLISVKHHLDFGILKGYATQGVAPLLVLFGCSGLIHLLAPGNGGGGQVDVDPAGLEVPLFLIPFLCLMGIMMLISFFGLASVNPVNACRVFVPGQSSTHPAKTLVALSCAGLLHLLVRTVVGRGSDGLISGGLELPILALFLAFMVSLVMVLSGISV